MPIFRFKTSDASGRIADQSVEGESQDDALRRLQRRGVTPLEFLGEGDLNGAAGGAAGLFHRFDATDFTERLVPLLEAHVPLERALGILADGLENPAAARIVQELRKGLHEGRKLSQMIRDRGSLFPSGYASVVEAGEEAGALPQVLADTLRFLRERRELQTYLISASIYPAFIAVVGGIVLAVLLGVIIPKFATVLDRSGTVLPVMTRMLIGASNLFRSSWWLLPLLAAAALLFWDRSRRNPRLSEFRDRWVLSLPGVSPMILCANLARMSRTLAILLRSGVPLLQTVSITTRIISNERLRQDLAGLPGALRQGRRLHAALQACPHIPAYVTSLVAIGEETGDVPGMLDRIATHYEEELRRRIRRLLSLFEPITIVGFGVVVGGIVLSMFMAVMELNKL